MKSPSIKQQTLDCQSAYDRWAPGYDAHRNPTVAMARMALERDVTDVKGLNIFEFGCGTGENLHNLGGKGAGSLTGVDVSEGMLSLARARLGAFEPCLFQITEREPDFVTDRKFDLILAVLVLEHVNDIDHFFRVAKGHMAERGSIYVSELHPAQSSKGVRAHFRDGDVEISTHSFFRTEREFTGAAERAGLRTDFVRSWIPDDEAVKREAKTQKYRDQPLLLTMRFVK